MRLKDIVYEDYVNYRKPSMFLGTCFCDFKCEKENRECHCQNSPVYANNIVDCADAQLVASYMENPLTSAIVIGGFEPFLQFEELIMFIEEVRKHTQDDIVIYTGYTEYELEVPLTKLKTYSNIIVKFGRFVPNKPSHFDEVLGVELASDNQYAIKL